MPQKLKAKISDNRRRSKKTTDQTPVIPEEDFNRLEFHRNAVALLPNPTDRRPGIAFQVEGGPKKVAQQFCSCRTSGTATCSHQKELSRVLAARQGAIAERSFYDNFQTSLWHWLATILAENERETPATIRLATIKSDGRTSIKIIGSNHRTILIYLSTEFDRERFLERCTQPPEDSAVPTRGEVIRQLALLSLTENERVLMDSGLKTRRQVLEETFWYKFAYHCFREFGSNGCTLNPAIDESSGAFTVTGTTAWDENVEDMFKLEIPRKLVKRVLQECSGLLS